MRIAFGDIERLSEFRIRALASVLREPPVICAYWASWLYRKDGKTNNSVDPGNMNVALLPANERHEPFTLTVASAKSKFPAFVTAPFPFDHKMNGPF